MLFPAAIGLREKLYDTYIHHILVGLADMLRNGIIQQFPSRLSVRSSRAGPATGGRRPAPRGSVGRGRSGQRTTD